jgi:hypothetical protein
MVKVMGRGSILDSFQNWIGEMISHGDGQREPVDCPGRETDLLIFKKMKIGDSEEGTAPLATQPVECFGVLATRL